MFGYGAADGEERARAAVARAFANPLLHFEGAVESLASLWVYVAGGPDMRFSEVQSLMQEVANRIPQDVRLYFGAAVDPQMEGAISVTLLAGIPGAGAPAAVPAARAPAVVPPTAPQQPPQVTQSSYTPAPEPEPEPAWTSPASSGAASDPESQFVAAPVQPSESFFEPEPVFEEAGDLGGTSDPYPDPVPAPTRSVPTPPFELSKERRREAAATLTAETSVLPVEVPLPVKPEEPAWEPVLPLDVEVAPVEPAPLPAAPQGQAGAGPQESPHEAQARKARENVQEQMRFEPVNRGRFEKTDPTIVDGEDLDVPTFMRQKVSLEP